MQKIIKLNENHGTAQESAKSILESMKDIALRPGAYCGDDVDVLGDLFYSNLSELSKVLGLSSE